MLIIGSLAMRHWGLTDREPRDHDIIGSYEEIREYVRNLPGPLTMARPINDGKKWVFKKGDVYVEGEVTWPGSTAEELVKLCGVYEGEVEYATLHVLYALKMSHRYLKNSPHFLKTMRDIQTLRPYVGGIPLHFSEWYVRREAETYNYAHPNLMQGKDGFFDGSVVYQYDHDTIHEAVAHLDRPAYLYYKADGAEVWCSKEKFDALPVYIRRLGVLEESYVLALERSQIPYDFKPDPKWSFDTALMKVCTSITSGWFREFAWENYDAIQLMYSPSYVKRFKLALLNGKIKEYQDGRTS